MITWMQRHKKYLVVTIWISVIAFVGAGFVGWGAYDFNSDRASAIAKVGNRKITIQEYQANRNSYYAYYKNIFGNNFTQEKADQMKLDELSLESLIEQTLILVYADEIGLIVTKDEIKKALINDSSFHKNGVFDKDTYYRLIKQSNISAKNYEDRLEKQILFSKISVILKLKPTDTEKRLFISSLFMRDKVEIKALKVDKNKIHLAENEIKEYWEKHKADYLSQKSYDIDTIEVKKLDKQASKEELLAFYKEKKYNFKSKDGKILDFNDAKKSVEKAYRFKLLRKKAKEIYVLFKNSQMNATSSQTVKEDAIGPVIEKLKNSKTGTTLKPIKVANGYIVVKIKKIRISAPKPYRDARPQVLVHLKESKFISLLEKKAKQELEKFKGKSVGFINRESNKKIAGLTQAQSMEFINHIFNNQDLKGYEIFGDRAILYRILEQKLLTNKEIKQYSKIADSSIAQIKESVINKNLIKKLKKRYSIERYNKGK